MAYEAAQNLAFEYETAREQLSAPLRALIEQGLTTSAEAHAGQLHARQAALHRVGQCLERGAVLFAPAAPGRLRSGFRPPGGPISAGRGNGWVSPSLFAVCPQYSIDASRCSDHRGGSPGSKLDSACAVVAGKCRMEVHAATSNGEQNITARRAACRHRRRHTVGGIQMISTSRR